MNPKTLTMTAFGPYKRTEIIDFTKLEDHRLFVISGNTGAGKTTIFDAICFALYGTASGQDREAQTMLRSDFADDATHTAVELTFEVSDRLFRILRQVGHIKKGNKTKTGDRYEFFEIIGDSEVPVVDRQIVSEINEQVEKLIGLTADQFKQIVMLPQGEFRKLLTSETENKEAILRRLFKTESYQKIGEQLLLKQGELRTAYENVEHELDTYVKQISGTLPKREISPLYDVLEQEPIPMKQLLQALKEEVTHYNKQKSVDQKAYEKAYETHQKKQTTYFEKKATNELFEELAQKEKIWTTLTEQKPIYQEKEKALKAAELASKLEPYEKAVNDWVKDEQQKQKAYELAKQKDEQAKLYLKEVTDKYVKEEKNKDKREAVRQTLDRLKSYLPTVKELNQLKLEIGQHETKMKETAKQVTGLNEEWVKQKKLAEENEETLQHKEKVINTLPHKQELYIKRREQIRLIMAYEKLITRKEALEKDLKSKRESLSTRKNNYQKLEQKWLQNQASILANELHVGDACPVCGSKEHPHLAEDHKNAVSRKDLDEAKQKLSHAEKEYQEIQVLLKNNQEQLQETITNLEEERMDVARITECKEEVSAEGKTLKEEIEQIKKEDTARTKLREAQQALLKKIQKLESDKEIKEKEHQTNEKSFERAKTIYEDRIKQIPEDVQILSDLEKKIKETAKEKEWLENKWETIQKTYLTAKEESTKASSMLLHGQTQLKEVISRKKAAEEALQTALRESAFESIEAYKRATLTAREREQLKQEIDGFREKEKITSNDIKQLKDKLKDKEIVDLQAIENDLAMLKKDYETALDAWNLSKRLHEDAASLWRQLTRTRETVEEREKELAIITELSNLIRGQNEQRISFERYLQMEYLDQIIEAANLRLRKLSNGQFHLERSDRRESHGRQSGLALDVHDAYTGQTRDVKTLSGGEKFNASLCLALGMSDVIQSFQGNVSIKTMFIDEGFGSLDEESLHKSIDALIDLQKSGRMIGVISHVKELKSIFPAVLEVSKTKEGYSETEVILK